MVRQDKYFDGLTVSTLALPWLQTVVHGNGITAVQVSTLIKHTTSDRHTGLCFAADVSTEDVTLVARSIHLAAPARANSYQPPNTAPDYNYSHNQAAEPSPRNLSDGVLTGKRSPRMVPFPD